MFPKSKAKIKSQAKDGVGAAALVQEEQCNEASRAEDAENGIKKPPKPCEAINKLCCSGCVTSDNKTGMVNMRKRDQNMADCRPKTRDAADNHATQRGRILVYQFSANILGQLGNLCGLSAFQIHTSEAQ